MTKLIAFASRWVTSSRQKSKLAKNIVATRMPALKQTTSFLNGIGFLSCARTFEPYYRPIDRTLPNNPFGAQNDGIFYRTY